MNGWGDGRDELDAVGATLCASIGCTNIECTSLRRVQSDKRVQGISSNLIAGVGISYRSPTSFSCCSSRSQVALASFLMDDSAEKMRMYLPNSIVYQTVNI